MKNRGLIATIVVMSGVIVTLLVVVLVIKMPTMLDILNIKDKVETEAKLPSETKVIVQTTEATEPEKRVEAKISTYEGYNDHVSIEYPVISGMNDEELQKRINFKIYMNALSIVPLYPISTALQDLKIYCEVKSLDEKYITILYTGSVVGNKVNSSSSSSKSSSSGSSSKSSGNDPYLNGFVDPLAGIGTNVVSPTVSSDDLSSLPLPKQDTGVQVLGSAETYKSITQAAAANYTVADTNTPNGAASKTLSGSADGGPTVQTISAPTAEAKTVYSENVALNSPNVSNSAAPNSSLNVGGIPVYSNAGSNTSAATIDQKIFYTNTIDLENCTDVTLKDYGVSIDTLAKYARSSEVQFDNVDSSNRAEVRKYVNRTILSTLTEQLHESDFRNIELKTWPKHFSYRGEDGTIYFTIKLSSKLGNYAIVKYKK